MSEQMKEKSTISHQFIEPAELLAHWQSHRNLTRRVIDAFPEEAFFKHSIGGMRTFAEITKELLAIAAPGLSEIVSGKASKLDEQLNHLNSKEKILQVWDESTENINRLWTSIKPSSFHNTVKSFGEYEGTVQSSILYFIDNEIHHRGQGYVYLRSLGIEPPFFWER